jgi:hypothetical protein
MDPVISPEECDWLLQPTPGLRRLGVDELNLTLIIVILLHACARLLSNGEIWIAHGVLIPVV